jgi:hypothetical protein
VREFGCAGPSDGLTCVRASASLGTGDGRRRLVGGTPLDACGCGGHLGARASGPSACAAARGSECGAFARSSGLAIGAPLASAEARSRRGLRRREMPPGPSARGPPRSRSPSALLPSPRAGRCPCRWLRAS